MSTHKDNLSEVTLAQLETLTGVAYKTIKKRLGALGPVRTDGKSLYFDPTEALPLIYGHGAAEGGDQTDPDFEYNRTFEAQRARLAKSQADRAELAVKKLQGELVDAEQVEAAWSDLVSAFRSKLLSIPTKVAPAVVGIEQTSVMEDALRTPIFEALAELSEYDASEFAPEDCGLNPEEAGPAAEADDQSVGGSGADALERGLGGAGEVEHGQGSVSTGHDGYDQRSED